jgi:hypothetical protein
LVLELTSIPVIFIVGCILSVVGDIPIWELWVVLQEKKQMAETTNSTKRGSCAHCESFSFFDASTDFIAILTVLFFFW